MLKYTGIPVSHGCIKSTAKVLSDDTDFDCVEYGDIIIVYRSSPGWIIPLMRAGGIICEVGGALSHLGILCREIGKPCVSGIPGIHTTIKNGDTLYLDGSTGEVIIYE